MLEVQFNPFPVITTERLVLRRIGSGDINEIYEMRRNDTIMKYICRPKPESTDEIVQLIDKINKLLDGNDGIAWAMTLKGDDKMMGHISFHVIYKENYRAEVGYMMSPEYYGKGLMDEALKAVLHYGFNTMGLHSVEADIDPENTASRKLVERNNFKQEAYFKEDKFWEGKFLDTMIYSLINPGS